MIKKTIIKKKANDLTIKEFLLGVIIFPSILLAIFFGYNLFFDKPLSESQRAYLSMTRAEKEKYDADLREREFQAYYNQQRDAEVDQYITSVKREMHYQNSKR